MPNSVSRRNLLALSAAATAAAACSPKGAKEYTLIHKPNTQGIFQHGAASGDPSQDGFVIWTRIMPPKDNMAVTGKWYIYKLVDENNPLGEIETIQAGDFTTDAAQDYTVKIIISGLEPASAYSYQFEHGIGTVEGSAKTLPEGKTKSAKFAVVSCANFQAGYFNVYDHISRREDIDAVLHLGDYYYEYGPDGWGGAWGEKTDRMHQPAKEITTLADYRKRHAQYRSDPNLQAMTARHALIPVWDDHEVSNDSYAGGAQNHQENEGDWVARREAALQAYYEWMPVRDPANSADRHKRSQIFEYGDLATLCAVETRLSARAEPIDIDDYTPNMNGAEDAARFKRDVLNVPDRHMLGEDQTKTIVSALSKSKESGQPWRVLLNQVIMGRILTADMGPYVDEDAISALESDWPAVRDFVRNSAFNLPVYPDSWDGYPWAREQFYGALDEAGVNDIITLTGDAHEFWAIDLKRDNGTQMGVELVTSSVSSPTLQAYFGDATADYNLLVTQANDDVRYYNALKNGYMTLHLTHQKGVSEMIEISTVTEQNYSAQTVASFHIHKRKDSLKFTKPKGLNFKQKALFAGLG